jgi:hypothetical protein
MKQVSEKWHYPLLLNSDKFSEAQSAGQAVLQVLWNMNIAFTDFVQEGLSRLKKSSHRA